MKTKPKVWAVMLVATGIGLSPLLPTQAADQSNAAVSFTDHALNPADPDLPLDDNSRVNLPDTSGEEPTKQVVVNTTPEQTKKATTTTKATPEKTTAAQAARRTLPQTGTVEMSGITVLSVIAMALMLVVSAFKQNQQS
ncbi:hypothetical protein [Lacticaseibacillus jixiensis]|uniref:hypothetical protein n=1 Tax=Lacticaseibacillus jixiensis TaxID=3231926 RepID=UPI0036F3BBF5